MTDTMEGSANHASSTARLRPEEGDTPNGWQDAASFELPLLNDKSAKEQLELLVLAWALLLYRGSFVRDGNSLVWGLYDLGGGTESARRVGTATLEQLFSGDSSSVSNVLEAIKSQSDPLQNVADWKQHALFFATADISSPETLEVRHCCCLRGQLAHMMFCRNLRLLA